MPAIHIISLGGPSSKPLSDKSDSLGLGTSRTREPS